MAVFPTKNLLLVTLFLLCFVSAATRARKLSMKIPQPPNVARDNGIARNEELQENEEELAIIDYTPARKKSPIHN